MSKNVIHIHWRIVIVEIELLRRMPIGSNAHEHYRTYFLFPINTRAGGSVGEQIWAIKIAAPTIVCLWCAPHNAVNRSRRAYRGIRILVFTVIAADGDLRSIIGLNDDFRTNPHVVQHSVDILAVEYGCPVTFALGHIVGGQVGPDIGAQTTAYIGSAV